MDFPAQGERKALGRPYEEAQSSLLFPFPLGVSMEQTERTGKVTPFPGSVKPQGGQIGGGSFVPDQ